VVWSGRLGYPILDHKSRRPKYHKRKTPLSKKILPPTPDHASTRSHFHHNKKENNQGARFSREDLLTRWWWRPWPRPAAAHCWPSSARRRATARPWGTEGTPWTPWPVDLTSPVPAAARSRWGRQVDGFVATEAGIPSAPLPGRSWLSLPVWGLYRGFVRERGIGY
jgi:hypothetical protein